MRGFSNLLHSLRISRYLPAMVFESGAALVARWGDTEPPESGNAAPGHWMRVS